MGFFALIFLMVVCQGAEAVALRNEPLEVGPFPMLPEFHAEVEFGWSNFEAARARASYQVKGTMGKLLLEGGTVGAARALWSLNATHRAEFFLEGLRSREFQQEEKYLHHVIKTRAIFDSGGCSRLRAREPRRGESRWKRFALEGIRDLVAAMFFIRSQRLEVGDRVKVLVFPGDSPFLAEVKVVRREGLYWRGMSRAALRMEFEISRIRTERGVAVSVERYRKFRKGSIWLSDDGMRFPLRAEVEIFVGFVYAELVSLEFGGRL